MAMRIKVVRESDGGNIGYRQSSLRFSVDMAIAALAVTTVMVALTSITSSEYMALGWWERIPAVYDASPGWWWVVVYCQAAFVGSEMVVLLLNKRKRAVHDHIAGTVVIHSETQPVEEESSFLGDRPEPY